MAAAVALLATGCKKDETEIRLSTHVWGDIPAGTRAANDILNTSFESGDNYYLYITDHTTNGVIADVNTGETGSNVGTGYYYPATGNTVDVAGYYPNTVMPTTTNFAVSPAQTNDATGKANYKASDLMKAVATNCARQDAAHNLQFVHQLSKIIVVINRDNSFASDQTATLTLKNANLSATIANGVFSALSGSTTTDVAMGSVNIGTTATEVAAIIPPQTIASGADLFTIALSAGGSYTYKTTAATTFAKGNAYKYTITVGLKEIKVTTTITDWGTGTTTEIGSVTI